MVREEVEGKLIHGYEYGAMNRLSRSWNDRGQEAVYLYNGLGQRTGKSVNGEEEDYLLDLTRGYHNLLDIQKEERGQRFYFDGNVTAMEETGGKTAIGRKSVGRTAFPGLHYYMQDELGSPLRVSGYRKKEGSFTGRSEYLTYWYDEFGNDLGGELEEAGIPSPYDRQRVEQPFGYTGYRYDEISGTYFAQAREYQPGNGRFTAEDVIKGNGVVPWTLNQYGYCLNNPIKYVDMEGLTSEDAAKEMIEKNAQYIYEAAEKFDIDPCVLAGCIYAEQVLNVDLKDKFDTTLVMYMGFDSSVGISQVKVSTARMLQENGYMDPVEKPNFIEKCLGIDENAQIAITLEDNETNIQYAAAYIKYQNSMWEEEYPEIWQDVAIQATIYNLGHEKLKDGWLIEKLGILFAGFKEQREPHANPESNDFGKFVEDSYSLMEQLLGKINEENLKCVS